MLAVGPSIPSRKESVSLNSIIDNIRPSSPDQFFARNFTIARCQVAWLNRELMILLNNLIELSCKIFIIDSIFPHHSLNLNALSLRVISCVVVNLDKG